MKVYLAGPDVFSPKARDILRRKAEICKTNGLEPLSPLDSELPPGAEAASAICRGNVGLMNKADAVIANLSPFRGVSLDPGVAFEIGYMASQAKLLCGYSNVSSTYVERVLETFGNSNESESLGRPVAGDDFAVENFGLTDNLMIIEAIRQSGGFVVIPEAAGDVSDITALEQFSECVRRLAALTPETGRSRAMGL